MQKGCHPSTMNVVRLQIASGLSVRPPSPRPIRIEKSYGGRPGGDFRHSSFSPTDYASSVSFSSAVGVQEAYSLLFFFFKFELRYQKISCHQDSLQFTLTTSRGKSDRGHSDWWTNRSKAHGRVSEPFIVKTLPEAQNISILLHSNSCCGDAHTVTCDTG